MKTCIRKTGWILGLTVILTMQSSAKVYWGVRAGVSRSSLVQKIDLDYHSGAIVGGSVASLMDIPFYERFSFRPEVIWTYQGGSFFSGINDSKEYTLTNNVKGHAIQVPLNLAFNIPIIGVHLAIYGGPAFDFRLNDKLSTKQRLEEPVPTPPQKIRPFDFGINTGISVEYQNVFFSISSLYGTLDRRKTKIPNDAHVYQNNLTFSIGYFFR